MGTPIFEKVKGGIHADKGKHLETSGAAPAAHKGIQILDPDQPQDCLPFPERESGKRRKGRAGGKRTYRKRGRVMGRYEELKEKRKRLPSHMSYDVLCIVNVLRDISETLALIYDTMTGDVDWPEDEEDLP